MAMISRNDTEAISAYLDGQLSPREQAQLEARLRREPALHAELEALDRTRSLLKAAPHYRAPRNFTLTPEMAGIPERSPGFLFGLTRLAFTLTTIMFLVALVGNFTFQGLGGSQPEETTAFSAEGDPAMAPLEEAAPAGESAADSGPMEDPGTERVQPTEDVEMESMESGENPDEIQALAPPTEESLSIAEETGPAEEPAGGGGPEPTLEADATVEETLDTAVADAAETEPLPAGADEDFPNEAPERINPWSIFTVLTGAAALLSGALTLAMRRR